MAAESQILEILLRVLADVTDINGKVAPAIAGVKTGLQETEVAAVGLGETMEVAFGGVLLGVLGGAVAALAAIPALISNGAEEMGKWNEEVGKQTAEVTQAVIKWNQLAETAQNFKDTVKLSDRIASDLQVAEANFAQWRAKELSAWQTFFDAILKGWQSMPGFGTIATAFGHSFAGAAADATAESRANLITEVQAAAEATKKADQTTQEWYDDLQHLQASVPVLTAQVKGLNAAIAEQDKIVADVAAKGTTATDLELHNAVAAKAERARLNEQLTVYQSHLKEVTDDLEDENKKTEDGTNAHQEFTAMLERERLALEAIKAQMASIDQNPFLTLGEKNAQQAELIPQAIANINAQIQANKQILSNSALDPAQYVRVQAEIQRSTIELGHLNQQLRLTTFSGQFGASLVQWVNQFGSVAQQTAGLITSTLGTAINGISNAITGLIFKTTTWGQAFAQIAQSIIGNIIQIFLQLAESQLVAFILRQTIGKAAQATTASEATAATAAWSPAAVAASIASYGGAAAAGQIAFDLAVASGTAFAVAASATGFDRGGYTGGREGRAAGVVHGEEFVFSAPAVRRIGVANLEALHRPNYASGGYVTPTGAASGKAGGDVTVHVFNFTDWNKLTKAVANSTANKKMIVHTVNRGGGSIRGS